MLALAFGAFVMLVGRRSTRRLPSLPVGDLLVVLEHAYTRLRPRLAAHAQTIRRTEHRLKTRASQAARSALARSRPLLDVERALSSWTLGVLLLVMASLLAFASMLWTSMR
jgi:hypothetical protein